jgi:hypothetical protein
MSVNVITAPRYEDTTEAEQTYTLPQGAMPAGKP